ncbi:MAG: hypothetical protein GX970_07940 [Phyllobacteriaceae bacterium]|nr:hypothetical protein [Phyllobacteriaceae bacterium]
MNNIRVLPIVIMAVGALLVLKTMGLVTNGGYVLVGTSQAVAAGGSNASAANGEITLPSEPTITDQTPTIALSTPTMEVGASTDHTDPADASDATEAAGLPGLDDAPVVPDNVIVAENACAPVSLSAESDGPNPDGELTVLPPDCPLPSDALPKLLTSGGAVPMGSGIADTDQALLERLAARRAELESYEQELAMRASLVTAAEQRIEQRQETLQSIEAQIASLVEQRKEMEAGQFGAIVAMYETMKPKDAANIFNALDIEVLLRVAKMMSPRKMAPILAEMDTARAQDLTVRLASNSVDPLETMTPDALASLPQIVGQ